MNNPAWSIGSICDKGNTLRRSLAMAFLLGTGCVSADTSQITADVWVDNWFELYANGVKVMEDSVSITTERSFNAETASFDVELPATMAFLAKDFKENATGLEYIGTNRQQMGDGGLIAQFKDADTGQTLAVSDANMRCLVVQRAPLDTACADEQDPVAGQGVCDFLETAIPDDWTSPLFDDSAWPAAVEHSITDVSPKGGYDRIDWDDAARLIWSKDLLQDNTLLCRLTIGE